MSRVNVNVVSQSELYFVDSDGARIRGNSFANLALRVTAYRERRGAPVGDVSAELQAQLAARNPGLARPGGRAPVPKQGLSFKGRVLSWLAEIRKRKASIGIVGDSERNARVNTCAGCPKNKPAATGCASCREVIAESRKEIIGRGAVDKRLGGCEALGIELNTACWLDEPAEVNDALPSFCWRKKTI